VCDKSWEIRMIMKKHNRDEVSEIAICRATSEDCENIAKIHTEAWKARYADFLPSELLSKLSVQKTAENTKRIIEEGEEETFIQKVNGQVIGFCRLGVDKDNSEQGQISAIYLSPDIWRKGYGTHLMRWSISYLKEKNLNAIILWSFIKNDAANKFYESCGFSRTGRTKTYKNKNNEVAIEYQLEPK
jgi:RimJ/RimL family protein N-acetyltransferase